MSISAWLWPAALRENQTVTRVARLVLGVRRTCGSGFLRRLRHKTPEMVHRRQADPCIMNAVPFFRGGDLLSSKRIDPTVSVRQNKRTNSYGIRSQAVGR